MQIRSVRTPRMAGVLRPVYARSRGWVPGRPRGDRGSVSFRTGMAFAFLPGEDRSAARPPVRSVQLGARNVDDFLQPGAVRTDHVDAGLPVALEAEGDPGSVGGPRRVDRSRARGQLDRHPVEARTIGVDEVQLTVRPFERDPAPVRGPVVIQE